jgi:hypothetical protein
MDVLEESTIMIRSIPLYVLSLAGLLLAGCSTIPQSVTEPAAPGSRYQVLREPALVAELRATSAPAVPVLEAGKDRDSEHRKLAAKGSVLIGTGYFPGTQDDAGASAIAQGQTVGAEQVLLYAPAAAGGDWVAAYYVRFQLPFGATFRDLRQNERTSHGASGVVLGSIVSGTPASRANLIPGDIVLKFDGKAIAGRTAFQDLLRSRAGHPVELTLVRNGETLERVVRLGVIAAEH